MAQILIQDPKSAYYNGPKTEAHYILYVKVEGRELYVEFDNDKNFAAALVKAGVNLHKTIESYTKPSLVPPKPE